MGCHGLTNTGDHGTFPLLCLQREISSCGRPAGGRAETEGHGAGGRRPASGHGHLAGDGGSHGRRDGTETESTGASRHTQEVPLGGLGAEGLKQ